MTGRAPEATGPGAEYLAGQRWFGAADRRVRSVVVECAENVVPGVDWLVLAVAFEDGGPLAHLQLFWDGSRDVAARPDVVAWLLPSLGAASAPVAALPGEQSNTSLVVGQDLIVKVFRRLTAERNPDAEAVRQLWEAGFRAVPEPLAESTRRIDVESLRPPAASAAGAAGGAAGAAAADGAAGEVDLAVARRFL
ncbi:MAG: hypothetical protein GEV08_05095, partial [Acidimicrobiia bacterium]|nr:hypothetical protein [Acidimicrobiia bacterium]